MRQSPQPSRVLLAFVSVAEFEKVATLPAFLGTVGRACVLPRPLCRKQ